MWIQGLWRQAGSEANPVIPWFEIKGALAAAGVEATPLFLTRTDVAVTLMVPELPTKTISIKISKSYDGHNGKIGIFFHRAKIYSKLTIKC